MSSKCSHKNLAEAGTKLELDGRRKADAVPPQLRMSCKACAPCGLSCAAGQFIRQWGAYRHPQKERRET